MGQSTKGNEGCRLTGATQLSAPACGLKAATCADRHTFTVGSTEGRAYWSSAQGGADKEPSIIRYPMHSKRPSRYQARSDGENTFNSGGARSQRSHRGNLQDRMPSAAAQSEQRVAQPAMQSRSSARPAVDTLVESREAHEPEYWRGIIGRPPTPHFGGSNPPSTANLPAHPAVSGGPCAGLGEVLASPFTLTP